jgi:hypothetical protein
MLQSSVSFGRDGSARFPARNRHKKFQGESPERGKGRREEKGKRGSLETPNFAGDARRNEELRRAICAAWRRFQREKERAIVEEVEGLI